jgi:hypothetical protein
MDNTVATWKKLKAIGGIFPSQTHPEVWRVNDVMMERCKKGQSDI